MSDYDEQRETDELNRASRRNERQNAARGWHERQKESRARAGRLLNIVLPLVKEAERELAEADQNTTGRDDREAAFLRYVQDGSKAVVEGREVPPPPEELR